MSALSRILVWLDVRRLAVAILFVSLFAMAVRAPADTDTWWHLQAGRQTLETGRILQTDLFSHTRYSSPWVNHSWLSQVILYWLFDHFSYAGLGLWMGAVVTIAFLLVYLQMEGDPFTRAFILVLAAATSAVIWVARPQLLSFLLTASVAYVLHLFKWKRINRLWLLPPIFALWVNLHAGYALGFMVLAAFVAGELFNILLGFLDPSRESAVGWQGLGMVMGAGVVSVLVLAINPNTTRMWTYYLDTVGIGALRDYIQEWQSPNFHALSTHPFIWLLLATLGTMGLSGRRADGTDLALVGVFAYASLLAGRNFGPFALVTAPVLSRHASVLLARWGWPSRPRPQPIQRSGAGLGALNLGLLILVVALAVVKVRAPLTVSFNERQQQESLPAGAIEWIREHRPPGELFNPYNWGGYLVWTLWPEYEVFVDGRTDLYGDAFLRQYLDVQLGRRGYEEILMAYDINLVLTYPGDGLSAQLACGGGWVEAYRDEVAVVWVREGE